VVFHNATLEEIAARRPSSLAELAAVPGIGPSKLARYGTEVLAALAEG
jgi:ATP-dependent DNA helicase RecQ